MRCARGPSHCSGQWEGPVRAGNAGRGSRRAGPSRKQLPVPRRPHPPPQVGAKVLLAGRRYSFQAPTQCHPCRPRPTAPCPLGTSPIRLIRSWQERHQQCQGVNKFVPSASCQKPAPKGGPFQAKTLIGLVTSIRNPFTLLRSISGIISMAAASGSGQDHAVWHRCCSPSRGQLGPSRRASRVPAWLGRRPGDAGGLRGTNCTCSKRQAAASPSPGTESTKSRPQHPVSNREPSAAPLNAHKPGETEMTPPPPGNLPPACGFRGRMPRVFKLGPRPEEVPCWIRPKQTHLAQQPASDRGQLEASRKPSSRTQRKQGLPSVSFNVKIQGSKNVLLVCVIKPTSHLNGRLSDQFLRIHFRNVYSSPDGAHVRYPTTDTLHRPT